MLDHIINHCRNHEFMSGVERDQERIVKTAEVFTPLELVDDMLNLLPQEVFTDETKTFLDNSCGDGQFLSEILIRKVSNGIPFEKALSTIYGVDIMQDNVDLCRNRLLCGQEQYRHIVENNIVCTDALTYHYAFNGEIEPKIDLLAHLKTPVKVKKPRKPKNTTSVKKPRKPKDTTSVKKPRKNKKD